MRDHDIYEVTRERVHQRSCYAVPFVEPNRLHPVQDGAVSASIPHSIPSDDVASLVACDEYVSGFGALGDEAKRNILPFVLVELLVREKRSMCSACVGLRNQRQVLWASLS